MAIEPTPRAEPHPRPLGYAPPAGRSWPARVVLGGVVVVVAAVIVAFLLLRPQHRVHDPRIRCASNLRQISQGVLMYANENKGNFPDDFTTLLLTQDLASEVFVCVSTKDTRAEGSTTQAVARNLESGGHVSYVYVGKGMNLSTPATAVVAYEPPSNHSGMNVVHADGTLKWLTPKEAQKLLSELAAGHNPPRP